MKRAVSAALALLLIVVALAGCAQAPASTSTVPASTTQTASTTPEAPLEITWAPRPAIGVMVDPDCTAKKIIEERFNVKITIEQVNIHDKEQYNLYWATGGNPTVLEYNNTAVHVFKLADQGLVRSFDKAWLEELMPNWMAANAQNVGGMDKVYEQITYNDEPYIIPFSSTTAPYGMYIRQDWLDNLGLELPKTAEQLVDVLKAFTFDDPDGNGVNDTYGIHAGSQKGYMRFGYLITMFDIWPDLFYDFGGKIEYSDTRPEYKEMLKYLNSIYELGVVDPAFASEDRVVQRNKWAAGNFGVIVDHPSWFDPNNGTNLNAILLENFPDAEVSYIPSFTKDGKNPGKSVAWFVGCADDGSKLFGASATDEQVKKVMEIYETILSDKELYMQLQYGVEGVDYEYDADKLVKKIGEAATSDEYAMKLGLYAFSDVPLTDEFQTAMGRVTKFMQNWNAIASEAEAMPIYTNYVQPASTAYDTLYNDVKTLSDEFYYNCIMGTWDVDAEWDAYQQRLVSAGMPQIVEEYNAAVFGK